MSGQEAFPALPDPPAPARQEFPAECISFERGSAGGAVAPFDHKILFFQGGWRLDVR